MQPKQQYAARVTFRRAMLVAAVAAAFGGAPVCAFAQQSEALSSLMNASAGRVAPRISPVREAILRPTAQALGTQTGMIEAAKEILQVVNDMGGTMDRTFRFGDLVMGQGVLPPVVVASHNSASIGEGAKMMRVAGSVYKIEEPARFFTGAPSWRDWLLMGLLAQSDAPELPDNPQLLPQDDKERAYWQEVVQKSYVQGREQAARIFEENLAGLERTYLGMRTFYELHGRGLVSLPRLATTQDVVNQTDANTIVVGDTVFRITVPSSFNTDTNNWRPTTGTTPTPAIPAQSVNLANPAFKPYVPAQAQPFAPAAPPAGAGGGAVQTAPVVAPAPQMSPAPADTGWNQVPQQPAQAYPGAEQVIRIRIGQGGGVTDASSYAPRPIPAANPYRVTSSLLVGVAFNADLPAMLPVRQSPVDEAQVFSMPSQLLPHAEPAPSATLPQVRPAPKAETVVGDASPEELARKRAELYAKAYADEFQRAYAAAANAARQVVAVSQPNATRESRKAVPGGAPVQSPALAPRRVAQGARSYQVQVGDTAYSVAARFGVSWQSLLERSGLQTPADVSPGVTLNIGASRG
ncbi:type IV secretory system conjugative DNA transfer family protein [Achromobacter animicus]|uniref:type IV secretory system conjugative DNA transfer family protein n=1 Tax=Achromobacter animicus TaxID=1389935 RepID=UPI0024483B7B|nr:type IV secretory system conjugative DNA transfer family protein [Achromobacter animicus]MDH0682879.1 type IV secretory system conjugative DNA transfer family protein [Achromobacter animicus]